MSAGRIAEAVLGVLKLVPEPHIAAAATAIDAVVSAVHQAHKDGIATGEPVTEADLRAQVAQAVAAALEPWQRIKDHAASQEVASAQQLGMPFGSIGE